MKTILRSLLSLLCLLSFQESALAQSGGGTATQVILGTATLTYFAGCASGGANIGIAYTVISRQIVFVRVTSSTGLDCVITTAGNNAVWTGLPAIITPIINNPSISGIPSSNGTITQWVQGAVLHSVSEFQVTSTIASQVIQIPVGATWSYPLN